MEVRKARKTDIKNIQDLLDSAPEKDISSEFFTQDYCNRVIKEGVLLVATENKEIIGVLLASFNKKEKWAYIISLVVKEEFRKKGAASILIKEFEEKIKKMTILSIGIHAHQLQIHLFEKLGYLKGQNYVFFTKTLNQEE